MHNDEVSRCEWKNLIPYSYHTKKDGIRHQHYEATGVWTGMATAGPLLALVLLNLKTVVEGEDQFLKLYGDYSHITVGVFVLAILASLIGMLCALFHDCRRPSMKEGYESTYDSYGGKSNANQPDALCFKPRHTFIVGTLSAVLLFTVVSVLFPEFFSLFSGKAAPWVMNITNTSSPTNVTNSASSFFPRIMSNASNVTGTVPVTPIDPVFRSDAISLNLINLY